LLAAADEPAPALAALHPRAVIFLAAVAPLLALGVYLAVGSPGQPDQPFAARVAAWREHPERYSRAELVAALKAIAAKSPGDPEPLQMLAREQLRMGDADAAIHSLRKATLAAPRRAELCAALGELRVIKNNGALDAEAGEDFRTALKFDPKSDVARYYLALGRVAAGDPAAGIAQWKALLADLAPNDPRRETLASLIASVGATGRLPTDDAQAGPSAQTSAAIRGMVDGLAARLKASPDDPDGWVRLVRAYTVLGETARRDAALAEARRRYATNPAVLARLRNALTAPE
jgi:cytochrome c-type biogenesis protein CcmH